MSSIDRAHAAELIKDGLPHRSCCGTTPDMQHLTGCASRPTADACPSCHMIGFHRPECEHRTADAINPKHYEHASGIETIRINRCMTFDVGNAFKYVLRAGQKDAIEQDLKKARWYFQDALDNDDPIWISLRHKEIGEPLLDTVLEHEIGSRYAIFDSIRDLDLVLAATFLDEWREEIARRP